MKSFIKALMSGGKTKTTGTEVISNVGIAKNLDTKRAIQDKDESQEDEMIRQLTNNKVKVKKDKKVKKNGNNRKQHNSK